MINAGGSNEVFMRLSKVLMIVSIGFPSFSTGLDYFSQDTLTLKQAAVLAAVVGTAAVGLPLLSDLWQGICGERLNRDEHGLKHFIGGVPHDILDLQQALAGGESKKVIARRQKLGVHPPRGILLLGPPGNGKTMLARGIAADVNAGFFAINAPDVVAASMWIGGGVRFLKDLFRRAANSIMLCRFKKAIIFIDEIDAIGRKRTAAPSVGGGSQEMRSIFNELLSKMDGFKNNPDIIVIGATNTADHLDPALLRRFTTQIFMPNPDFRARRLILLHYLKGRSCEKDFRGACADRLAVQSEGFSAADLKNSVDRAALNVFRDLREEITFADMVRAIDEIKRSKEVARQSFIGEKSAS